MSEGFVNQKELQEEVIELKRVSKKTTGGSKMSFTALVVVGNKKGRVGSGVGKATDVPSAIQKALTKARRSMVDVKLNETTIAHQVSFKYGAAEVFLKPAPKGSGIIAGGSVRKVLGAVGIRDISAKMLGSNNKTSNVRCTIGALKKLKGMNELRSAGKN